MNWKPLINSFLDIDEEALNSFMENQDYRSIELRVVAFTAKLSTEPKKYIFDTWVEWGRQKTFIEFWSEVTGHRPGSEEYDECLQWVLLEHKAGRLS